MIDKSIKLLKGDVRLSVRKSISGYQCLTFSAYALQKARLAAVEDVVKTLAGKAKLALVDVNSLTRKKIDGLPHIQVKAVPKPPVQANKPKARSVPTKTIEPIKQAPKVTRSDVVVTPREAEKSMDTITAKPDKPDNKNTKVEAVKAAKPENKTAKLDIKTKPDTKAKPDNKAKSDTKADKASTKTQKSKDSKDEERTPTPASEEKMDTEAPPPKETPPPTKGRGRCKAFTFYKL